mgnify:FL=1
MRVSVWFIAAGFVAFVAAGQTLGQDAPAASKGQAGGATDYPKIMSAAEIQAFYGAKEMTIEYQGKRGAAISIRTHPDGTLFGSRAREGAGRIGMSVAKHEQSSGTWKTDSARDRVCHEWNDAGWPNTCFLLRQTGADNYEYATSRDAPGMPLTVKSR